MKEFGKQERRILRQLADLAYERELGNALAQLEKDFARWRSGEISPFELSNRIHRFHNGQACELYSMNATLKPWVLVSRAVAAGLLAPDEVPSTTMEKLADSIELFRERNS